MNGAKVRQDATDALKAATPLSVRKWLVRKRLASRQLTAGGRSLPDFLILGGQRCGTSSLYKYLGRHPQIAPSLRKEIEYFTINYGLGEAWYRSHFPLEIRRKVAEKRGRPLRTFEATPDYLFDPRAPERAAALVPSAGYIVLLRDPVDRAHSHYYHNVRLGLEDLSFEDAIAAEHDRLADDLETIRRDPLNKVKSFRRYSYLSRGHYAEQLVRWFEHIPRDQFLFLWSEDFFEHPGETFHRILDFAGVSHWSPPEFRNYSYAGAADAGNPELSAATRRGLHDHFASPNRELEQLLGVELPWGDR